jgi:hypothetical protein
VPTIRLSEFIEQHHGQIIDEWAAFARTLLPWSKGLSDKDLRDHAEELLSALVRDMSLPESGAEQSAKSKGHSDEGVLGGVGHKHASERLRTGFTLDQLVAEYRALRASVLRLWEEASSGDKQREVTRFNEAIDESLAEATVWYVAKVNETRDQFLAILGHDLRNPLSAITMGAELLGKSKSLDEHVAIGARIRDSAKRMNRLIGSLLDLTRTRLGTGLPVTRQPVDLTAVCQQAISELQVSHPDCKFKFEAKGDLRGDWDGDRLSQLVSNLAANAAQYGGQAGTVGVVAEGRGEQVVLRVHNVGPIIPESALDKIFNPMVRQPPQEGDKNPSGLGLGLYIAREIATAHGGTLDVTSTEKDGTTFTATLPRRAPGETPARS